MADVLPLPLRAIRLPPARWSSIGWSVLGIAMAVVIAVVDPRTALGLCAFLATFLLSIERINLGLGVLVATIPVQDTWPVAIGGISFTWTRLALLAVVIAWLSRWSLKRSRLVLPATVCWMAAYCASLLLSVVHAGSLSLWAAETYRWGAALVVFVIATSADLDREKFRAVAAGLAGGILFSAVIAVDQVLTGTGPESFAYRGLLRAYGLFGEPNPFAAYLEMAVLPLLALALARTCERQFWRWPAIGTFMLLVSLLGTGILGLTQSRGGALGFLAGAAVIVWYQWPRWGRTVIFACGVIVIVALATPPAAPVRELLGIDVLLHDGPVHVTTANFGAQERLAHWGAAWRMWMDEPWLGVGAGNFPERYRAYTPVWRFRISRGHAHSAYLQAAAQAGTIGLICFLGLLGACLHRCRRAIESANDRTVRAAAVGALAVTVAVAIHGVFDYVHVLSLSILLSVVWGMANDQCPRVVGGTLNHDGN